MKHQLCDWLLVILIILAGSLLFVLACRERPSEQIILPSVSEIGYIEIINSNDKDNAATLYSDYDISVIFNRLKANARTTKKNSVNDQPTAVQQYYIMELYYKNIEKSPTVMYLYKKNNLCYVEQPYSGIWRIKQELYNEIVNTIEHGNS